MNDETALIEKIKKEYVLAGRPDIENFEVRVEESNNTLYEKLANAGILKRNSLEFVCRNGQIVVFWCYLLTQGY